MGEGEAFTERVGALPPQPVASTMRSVVRSRHRDRDFALRRALLVADLLGLWLALALALALGGNRGAPFAEALWMAPVLPLWALLFHAYGLYGRPIRRFEPTHLDDAPSLFHALVLGTLGMGLYFRMVAPVAPMSLREVIVFGVVSLPLIASLRVGLRALNLRMQGPERVFALAPREEMRLLRRKLRTHPEYEMKLVGSLASEGCEELGLRLSPALAEVEDVVASGEVDHVIAQLDAGFLDQERLRELMRACHREGIRFSCFPAARGLLSPGVELNYLEGMGIVTASPPVLGRASRALKRGMDVVVSGLASIALAPLMGLVAIAIRLDSKGPVLYRQVRVGKDGRRFKLHKFRTMAVGADRLDDELMVRSADPHWLVMDEDPRVTRVGRFLRRTSLDELPQLWNVLKGEMSMVGPRPLSQRDDRNVRGWQRHRLDLVPGITGYWQVLGRNSIPFSEMLEVDYAYVASWSLWHDMRILAQTVPAVLRRRGAN